MTEILIIIEVLHFHIYLQQQTYKLGIAMSAAVESFISFTFQ